MGAEGPAAFHAGVGAGRGDAAAHQSPPSSGHLDGGPGGAAGGGRTLAGRQRGTAGRGTDQGRRHRNGPHAGGRSVEEIFRTLPHRTGTMNREARRWT
ncbi:hypothetical protein F1189_16100 [Rhodovastum atsumiense]|uniref:Uncharacterized protein n=1 Tax=Rhodovastum atsumiense TaxID=504468 RepID=A0A5M6IUM8_9PROT|nr:hypothetical protein F1189_16100 [Rhodovastum atsumiense]